jgi:hypothetical protein
MKPRGRPFRIAEHIVPRRSDDELKLTMARTIDPDCWRAGTEFGERVLTLPMMRRRHLSLQAADRIFLLMKDHYGV